MLLPLSFVRLSVRPMAIVPKCTQQQAHKKGLCDVRFGVAYECTKKATFDIILRQQQHNYLYGQSIKRIKAIVFVVVVTNKPSSVRWKRNLVKTTLKAEMLIFRVAYYFHHMLKSKTKFPLVSLFS